MSVTTTAHGSGITSHKPRAPRCTWPSTLRSWWDVLGDKRNAAKDLGVSAAVVDSADAQRGAAREKVPRRAAEAPRPSSRRPSPCRAGSPWPWS
jgi:hypothetical protein